MITLRELNLLLMAHYTALGESVSLQNPQGFIEHLSKGILQATEERTLPDFETLRTSPEARTIFKTIIQESHDVRSTKLTHLIQAVHAEILNLKTQKNKDTSQINTLLNHVLDSKFMVYGDRFHIKNQTGITWQIFTAGLTKDHSPEQLETFEKAFICWASLCEKRVANQKDTFNPDSEIYKQLTKISLQLLSEQCVDDINQETGPVRIIHFYENKLFTHQRHTPCSPRASEYLDTYDSDEELDAAFSFDKTSHGLGSGIYGLGVLSQEAIDEQIEVRKSHFKIFTIQFPLRLIDNDARHESDQLTEISKNLQRTCDQITNMQIQGKQNATGNQPHITRDAVVDVFYTEQTNNDNLDNLVNTLCNFQNITCSPDQMRAILLESIHEFFCDADLKKGRIVPMPINYLLKKLGFTGIVSSINDKFNRGLVAIEPEENTADLTLIPVKSTRYGEDLTSLRCQTSPWSGALTPTAFRLSGADTSSPRMFRPHSASTPSFTDISLTNNSRTTSLGSLADPTHQ